MGEIYNLNVKINYSILTLLKDTDNRFHEWCWLPNSMHALIFCHSGRTHTFGVQTLPSVTAAGLHLIDGICAGIRSILLF